MEQGSIGAKSDMAGAGQEKVIGQERVQDWKALRTLYRPEG